MGPLFILDLTGIGSLGHLGNERINCNCLFGFVFVPLVPLVPLELLGINLAE